jgi:hypothetical protein
MAVDLELAPKRKRQAGAACCEPVVYPDVERDDGGVVQGTKQIVAWAREHAG